MAEKTTRKRSRRKQPGLTLASAPRRRSVFAPVEDAVDAIRQGQMVIVVDDEDRENEGDLTVAAEKTTPEAINFMAKYGRGLICLPMTGDWLDRLDIPLMVRENTSQFDTAFCVSIEAKESTSTGISAADRATTACVAADPQTTARDLVRPGHMFPLRARDGGVMVRAGQTEAAVDLARIAGLRPAGVICEIMNEDGTMARVPELTKFAKKHGLLMITIADLIKQAERALLPERLAMGAGARRQGAQAGRMTDQTVIERGGGAPVRFSRPPPFRVHGLDRGFQPVASGRSELQRTAQGGFGVLDRRFTPERRILIGQRNKPPFLIPGEYGAAGTGMFFGCITSFGMIHLAPIRRGPAGTR